MSHLRVLLVGETGAGKSTTINALANYLKFESFDSAIKADKFIHTIPARIHLYDPKTFAPLVVDDAINDDQSEESNEQHNDQGRSVTQEPRSYQFDLPNHQQKVTIIDTPGLGDTRGIEMDRKNWAMTKQYLRQSPDLDAILFLLKTNTTRKTATFRHCLAEVLDLLDRHSLKTNLLFCFTFSRNSLYGPGDGFDTLRSALSEAGVELQVTPDRNCFFLDNEAYHYLIARQNGFPFTATKERSFQESWDKSSKAVRSLLSVIGADSVPKIPLSLCFQMEHYRTVLPLLEEPMEQLVNEIDQKIEKTKQLSQNENNDNDLLLANELEEELNLIKVFVVELCNTLIEYSSIPPAPLVGPFISLLCSDETVKVTEFIEKARSSSTQSQKDSISVQMKKLKDLEGMLRVMRHKGPLLERILPSSNDQQSSPKVPPTTTNGKTNAKVKSIIAKDTKDKVAVEPPHPVRPAPDKPSRQLSEQTIPKQLMYSTQTSSTGSTGSKKGKERNSSSQAGKIIKPNDSRSNQPSRPAGSVTNRPPKSTTIEEQRKRRDELAREPIRKTTLMNVLLKSCMPITNRPPPQWNNGGQNSGSGSGHSKRSSSSSTRPSQFKSHVVTDSKQQRNSQERKSPRPTTDSMNADSRPGSKKVNQ